MIHAVPYTPSLGRSLWMPHGSWLFAPVSSSFLMTLTISPALTESSFSPVAWCSAITRNSSNKQPIENKNPSNKKTLENKNSFRKQPMVKITKTTLETNSLCKNSYTIKQPLKKKKLPKQTANKSWYLNCCKPAGISCGYTVIVRDCPLGFSSLEREILSHIAC